MNNLYFACEQCKEYVDAGYRWAYWTLEVPGVVKRGHTVDIESVVRAERYWTPSDEPGGEWIAQELHPMVREFFRLHRTHRVMFGEDNLFPSFSEPEAFMDWLERGPDGAESPRMWVETLGFTSWDQVTARGKEQRTLWLLSPDLRERAQQRFFRLVASRAGLGKTNPA